MGEIKKIAVLGSGVMGSGIAAQAANAGVQVVLLDIVPKDAPADERSALAKRAIDKQKAGKPPGFTHPLRVGNVYCGNLEDDLDQLADCDWIIEAVLEKLEVKQEVYRKINAVRKPGSVVSSNTSTLPLHELTAGFPDSFRGDLMIAHFFNPPRFMRLLEVVKSPYTRADAYDAVCNFADVALGKGLVPCKDTPGFIANRIGVYWLMQGLLVAIRQGVSVEEADAVMGKPVGIPKTAVFGLFDLIGIDLMPLIAKSMLDNLPQTDDFRQMYQEPDVMKKMIEGGYTGRKGKGGFYRINAEGGKKVKEVISLSGGQYHPEGDKVELASITAGKEGLRALVSHPDKGGRYALEVLTATLHYAASLIPEISDDIAAVDDAMRMGYNWKFGPFEMIDQLGVDWFIEKLEGQGKTVPAILQAARGKALYERTGTVDRFITLSGEYVPIAKPQGSLMVGDLKRGRNPIASNRSASLWDMGDGIACLELTSKMNAIDMDILSMMEQSVAIVQQSFKGLVIGNDAEHFSAGANLSYMLEAAKGGELHKVSDLIKRGQAAMMGLKYAPFPVVASLTGMALGGGCELALHSNAIQAHMESYPGLVEVGVGLIPGWGGCKEMLLRHNGDGVAVFDMISAAKTAGSADDAREMGVLQSGDLITMNRVRVLADAKVRCLGMVNGYVAPMRASVYLAGKSIAESIEWKINANASASEHDKVIWRALAHVLSAGMHDGTQSEDELLELEHEAFMKLVALSATQDRIAYMLVKGKPLKN